MNKTEIREECTLGSTHNPAVRMTVKRFAALACALGLALAVGACTSFSDVVADHWPHIAGGEPNGVPPRPGAPGYNRFIAHGQPEQGAASGAGNGQPAATAAANQKPGGTGQSPTAFTQSQPQNEQTGGQLAPAVAHPDNSSEAVQGGLY
jgi:hypothetical protein